MHNKIGHNLVARYVSYDHITSHLVDVKGYDTTMGFSTRAYKPCFEDAQVRSPSSMCTSASLAACKLLVHGSSVALTLRFGPL